MDTILDKLKSRETWSLLLQNGLGILMILGVLDQAGSDEWGKQLNDVIGAIFILIGNGAFVISRGIAKAGAEGAETVRIKALNKGMKIE